MQITQNHYPRRLRCLKLKMPGRIYHKKRCSIPLQRVPELAYLRGNAAQRKWLQAFHSTDLFHRSGGNGKLIFSYKKDNYVFTRLHWRLRTELFQRLQIAPTFAAPKM